MTTQELSIGGAENEERTTNMAQITTQEVGTAFNKVHEAGAQRHPTRWLIAHNAALRAMEANSVAANDPALKLLVSTVVLKVLDAVIPKEQR